MPKTFYTERDIEDLVRNGVRTLTVNDDVVLTELAYETAEKLGIKLTDGIEKPPSAPLRPYIAKQQNQTASTVNQTSAAPTKSDLKLRIRDAVITRIGSQVDPALLDTIIERVLNNVSFK